MNEEFSAQYGGSTECNWEVTCDSPGCAGCCDVKCPPEGLCDSITYRYLCTTPYGACSSNYKYKTYNILGIKFKRKIKKTEEDMIKELSESKKFTSNAKKEDLLSLNNLNKKLGIKNLPKAPSFHLDQSLIKAKNKLNILANEDDQILFALAGSCSIPCYYTSISVGSSSPCGISAGGCVGGSVCCCGPGPFTVTASGGGGACGGGPSWTSQTVNDEDCVGAPSITGTKPCCGCGLVETICNTSTSLLSKRYSQGKIQLSLNKKELLRRVSKINKIKIYRRQRKLR